MLRFKQYKLPRLTKAHEPAFFEAWIERSPGDILFGSGLRDEMLEQGVGEIIVPITYKGTNEHWYLSPTKIERDLQGLSVRPLPRKEISQPT
jgi:hypothetical protein